MARLNPPTYGGSADRLERESGTDGIWPRPDFTRLMFVSEIEERHDLAGQPGKIKITGFLDRGRLGSTPTPLLSPRRPAQPADITTVRHYTSRPGIRINLEQQITESFGLFARAGWADGKIEPWAVAQGNRMGAAERYGRCRWRCQ
jgi:high affinity Mn2+ porin